jgi:hypothetical protein
MSKIRKYLSGTFKDINGNFSYKRFQTFLFTFLFSMYFIANLFWKYTINDSLSYQIFFLIVYGYTGIALEQFKKTPNPGDIINQIRNGTV